MSIKRSIKKEERARFERKKGGTQRRYYWGNWWACEVSTDAAEEKSPAPNQEPIRKSRNSSERKLGKKWSCKQSKALQKIYENEG